jgi:hypothetical protein
MIHGGQLLGNCLFIKGSYCDCASFKELNVNLEENIWLTLKSISKKRVFSTMTVVRHGNI